MRIAVFFLALLFSALVPSKAHCADRYFELGVGAGTDLHSLDMKDALIAPSINWGLRRESLRFRIEADLEAIHGEKTTLTAGIAPMLRLYLIKKYLFMDGGIGANYISHKKIEGRQLGGNFIFSSMAGVGLEFHPDRTPVILSYRYRHLSNGGIYRDNKGIDLHYLLLSFGFR